MRYKYFFKKKKIKRSKNLLKDKIDTDNNQINNKNNNNRKVSRHSISFKYAGTNNNNNVDSNANSNNKSNQLGISNISEMESYINIELYYRKISTPDGNVIESYFNDITSVSKVEKEKAENKIRSLILAKISHEFKTPSITIIYILKNYISKNLKYERTRNHNNNNVHLQSTINMTKSSINEDSLIEINNNPINISNNNSSRNNKLMSINTNNDIGNIYNNEEARKDKYIKNTIDLSDYMLSLIDDIIDFSLIDSSFELKFGFETFNLHKLLNFCYSIMKILIDCKDLGHFIKPYLEISENVPNLFYSDEMRLKQVLLNLIFNSIKFTRRGFIQITAKNINYSSEEIAVEDTEIGIRKKI